MKKPLINDVNILSAEPIPSPGELKQRMPLTVQGARRIQQSRAQVRGILDRDDPRLLAVVGPCSIHHTGAAREYAHRLAALTEEVGDTFLLVMRVYFEKPRTTVGWKGFINDPCLDDSFRIADGLAMAREFLLALVELGLPAGTEALDPITPQYIGDLVSWTAIGARTTESQTHREMASGLSTPVGFKNITDGSVATAVNAIQSARQPHHFLGITEDGRGAVFHTRGNRHGHMVLRGGAVPNYDAASVAAAERALQQAGLPVNIVIDCSHANSGKDPDRQPAVLGECVRQIRQGNRSIVGFMLESNLEGGRQDVPADVSLVRPGQSVTDACLDWLGTAAALRAAAGELRPVLGKLRGDAQR